MGNEDDFELELLRQAALSSLQRNRANKGGSPNVNRKANPLHPHRPVPHNMNLIQIQTRSDLLQDLDSGLMEEIVVAEGIDMDDSDCDEVIEEVIMSDGDSGRSSSPVGGGSFSPVVQESSDITNKVQAQPQPSAVLADDSSSDDDALSFASRYSLYDEDFEVDQPTQRLPQRLRPPPNTNTTSNEDKDDSRNQNQRRRSPHRSRSRDRERTGGMRASSRSRSPPPRNRRQRVILRNPPRSRSPLPSRRRPIGSRRSRSRSREREFRGGGSGRRSSSRERELSRADNSLRDKLKRKDDGPRSRPARSPPIRRDYLPRRRSRSRSLSREKRSGHDISSRGATTVREKEIKESNKKLTEPSSQLQSDLKKSSSSPEPPRTVTAAVSGVDQDVLEKRRRKFQEKQPLTLTVESNQRKKIRLPQSSYSSSNNRGGGSDGHRERPRNSPEIVHKETGNRSRIVEKLEDSEDRISSPPSASTILVDSKRPRPKDSRADSPTNIKVNVEADSEPEQEDLRAKLIKKKMKAQQQGHHVAPGRIFSEALKGTRLGSSKVTTKPTKSTSSRSGSGNGNSSSSKEKSLAKAKRKVSLTYA